MTMSKEALFWRNVTLIGLAHVAVFAGWVRWSHASNSLNSDSIVWMTGGMGNDAAKEESAATPKHNKAATPSAELSLSKTEETEDEEPFVSSVKSDIQLPTP